MPYIGFSRLLAIPLHLLKCLSHKGANRIRLILPLACSLISMTNVPAQLTRERTAWQSEVADHKPTEAQKPNSCVDEREKERVRDPY